VLVTKAPANFLGEVSAFGIGSEEVVIFLRRKVEIGIEFAVAKKQVEDTLVRSVFRGTEDAGVETAPVHG
jgi:hypothetical protein